MHKVADLGCIVCANLGYGETPAEIHHIGNGALGKRSSNYEVIPLCPNHHRHADGTKNFQGHIAVHKNKTEFEARYGTEKELLEQVKQST